MINDSPFNIDDLVFHHNDTDGYVDVMGPLDKGDGVELITSLFSSTQVPSAAINTIAVGNGLNDMPMLQAAEIPVCPANAEPEVKAYCRNHPGVVSDYEFIHATLDWLETQAS